MSISDREISWFGDRASRRSFLASSLAVAASTLVTAPGVRAAGPSDVCCPRRLGTFAAPASVSLAALATGNQQAMDLARRSSRVMVTNEAVLSMADGLADPQVRMATLDVLRNPAPHYQL